VLVESLLVYRICPSDVPELGDAIPHCLIVLQAKIVQQLARDLNAGTDVKVRSRQTACFSSLLQIRGW